MCVIVSLILRLGFFRFHALFSSGMMYIVVTDFDEFLLCLLLFL